MHLDHVGLSVADLEAMTRWYCDTLGLRESAPFTIDAIGLRGTFVIGDDGFAIELLEREGSQPGLQAPDTATALLTRGYGHIALRIADVEGTHAALLAAGASERMPPQQSPEAGVRMSFVADPEGNLIELLDRSGAVGS
ncbi:glyoxylase I family protein [Homoserinimonas aerilata]|uniref:Glyoxylase I family protein n=2 Tax=Homoserinimonas aerilata TaxID=1162970 RepID=A0A542YJY2_9MICO|nr:glyoxylase I family protein [Homoserinimonas aerilata]